MYKIFDDDKRKETRETIKKQSMYLNKKQNKKVRNMLKYEIKKYNKRVDNIENKLVKTGQAGATPQHLNIDDLSDKIENKHQINALVKHMDKIRVSALGKKTDKGYEGVIEGKKGAKILKVEQDKLRYDIQKINRRRNQELKNLEKRGYKQEGFELYPLCYDLDDLKNSSLITKKENILKKSFITDVGKKVIQQRRENIIDACYTTYSTEGRILELLIDNLTDRELDTFLRESGSKISFDFIYSKYQVEDHLEKILYYFELHFGNDKYNELMERYGRDDLKDIAPPLSITPELEEEHMKEMHKKLGY